MFRVEKEASKGEGNREMISGLNNMVFTNERQSYVPFVLFGLMKGMQFTMCSSFTKAVHNMPLHSTPIHPAFLLLLNCVEDRLVSEFDDNLLAGEALVDTLDDFDLLFQEISIGLIQEATHDISQIRNAHLHLADAGSIDSDASSLADDIAWGEEVLEDTVMDCGQGSASWSDLRAVNLQPL